MDKWEQDLDKLLYSGSTGCYHYCKVDQIVLIDKKTHIAWNYFTHICFSRKFTAAEESTLYSEKPISIGKKFTLFISHYITDKEKFKECVQKVPTLGIWDYTDSRIDKGDRIDEPFITDIKYVSANDPTGSEYGSVIPLERSLYGSNFSGNYYIFEIYGKAQHLKEILNDNDIERIQKEINKYLLNYSLDKLNDRIGNIICRFDVETMVVTPVPSNIGGIAHQYKLAADVNREINLHFHIEREHDRLLYDCSDEYFTLKPGESITKDVESKQCKVTITVTDTGTNLILYRIVSDRSVYSNYRGQVNPSHFFSTSSTGSRKIKIGESEISVPFINVQPCGGLGFFVEMGEASKRQQRWDDSFFEEKKYLKVYTGNANKAEKHQKALEDIRSIINEQLLWDLKEVCIIDPYLSPNDILNTVAFCRKKDIHARCLTAVHTISKNEEARSEILSEAVDLNEFSKIKEAFRKQLEEAIGSDSDLQLSYRTIHDNNGAKFHDRYLILKYEINKTRVWSLGTSINSVGKSHHIIQIVESPTLIEKFFNQVWDETAADECKIYDYSDYITETPENGAHPDIISVPMISEEELIEGQSKDSNPDGQEQTTQEE